MATAKRKTPARAPVSIESVQVLRDIANQIESGQMAQDTPVALVYGAVGGSISVRGAGAGAGTLGTIALLEVGKTILLNQLINPKE